MILAPLDQVDRYAGLHPLFAKALAFLRSDKLESMPNGKHAIDGERLFVLLSAELGKGPYRARLESHRKYIDIQMTLQGIEIIGWKPAAACMVGDAYDAGATSAITPTGPTRGWCCGGARWRSSFPKMHAPLAGKPRPQSGRPGAVEPSASR